MILRLRKSHPRWFLVLAIFACAIILGSSWGLVSLVTKEEPYYIAVVGPMTGKSSLKGAVIQNGVDLYVRKVNRLGGINGRKVKTLVFDDKNDQTLAVEVAEKIAANEKILLVIGHRGSDQSMKAGLVYKKNKIPAISGSATSPDVTKDNPWYFRTIFSNAMQAELIANYAKKVLKHDRAIVIYRESSSYEKTLKEAFERLAPEVPMEVAVIDFEARGLEDVDFDVENLADILPEIPHVPPNQSGNTFVFLAMSDSKCGPLVKAIRDSDNHIRMIGADSVGKGIFWKRFIEDEDDNGKEMGFYTEGIYATTPLIFDVASPAALEFEKEYKALFGNTPDAIAATYYDAAQVGLAAIDRSLDSNSRYNLQEHRKSIRDQLAAMNDFDSSIPGITNPIYFDDQGDLDSSNAVPMGLYQSRQMTSAAVQLIPKSQKVEVVSDKDIVTHLIGGNQMQQTDVVYTGIDINRISDLNLTDGTYTVDFFLWFRYQKEVARDDIEFINVAQDLGLGDPIREEIADDGTYTYRVYRLKGQFKGEFIFENYPFDQQDLKIQFRQREKQREDLVFVKDILGMRSSDILKDHLLASGVLDTSQWSISDVQVYPNHQINDSNLGNPSFFDQDTNIEYSQFNVDISINRNTASFILKNLVPVFIIVGIGYIALFIPVSAYETRIGLGTSTLLTMAFFNARLSNELPDIGYLVAIEYIFYVVYGLSLFVVFISLINHLNASREVLVGRLNLASRITYPLVVMITAAVISYIYLL